MPNKPKELYPSKNILKLTLRDFVYGSIPEIEIIPFQKGELTPYKKGLINAQIINIANKCKRFKIGVTGDIPIRIDDKIYREDYDFISVVYKCKSESRSKDYEVELIEKFIKLYPEKIDNKSSQRATKDLITYDWHYKIYVVYLSS